MSVWVWWAIGTLGSFGVLEGLRLAQHNEPDTLSGRLRAWLGVDPHKPWRTGGLAVFVGFMVWFFVHIIFNVP